MPNQVEEFGNSECADAARRQNVLYTFLWNRGGHLIIPREFFRRC